MKDFTIVDTGLRFAGHPIMFGSDCCGRPANKLLLTRLDRFLKCNLPDGIVEVITNHSTGLIIEGAVPEVGERL